MDKKDKKSEAVVRQSTKEQEVIDNPVSKENVRERKEFSKLAKKYEDEPRLMSYDGLQRVSEADDNISKREGEYATLRNYRQNMKRAGERGNVLRNAISSGDIFNEQWKKENMAGEGDMKPLQNIVSRGASAGLTPERKDKALKELFNGNLFKHSL